VTAGASVEDDGIACGAHPLGSLGEEYWGVEACLLGASQRCEVDQNGGASGPRSGASLWARHQ
jgi:hypothetical protein